MRGSDDAADDRAQMAVAGAWWGELFARQDKLRPLKAYLKKQMRSAKAAVRQTAAEIAAALGQRSSSKVEIVDKPRPKGM